MGMFSEGNIPPELKALRDVILIEVSFEGFLPFGNRKRRELEGFSKTVNVGRNTGLVEATFNAVNVILFDCGTRSNRTVMASTRFRSSGVVV